MSVWPREQVRTGEQLATARRLRATVSWLRPIRSRAREPEAWAWPICNVR